jgi:hypothetical protein
LKNWKSLKIFFRTTGWIETKFSHNAGTADPQEQMRASSNQIIVLLVVLEQIKCKKLTDDRHKVMGKAHLSSQPW